LANEIERALFTSGILDTWHTGGSHQKILPNANSIWTAYLEYRVLAIRDFVSFEAQQDGFLSPMQQIYKTAFRVSREEGLGENNTFRANVKALCTFATSSRNFRPNWLTGLYLPHAPRHNIIVAAAYLGHFELCRRLLELYIPARNFIWGSPYAAAALGGHTDVMELFLGDEVFRQNSISRYQAIRVAAAEGHTHTFNLLTEERWDPAPSGPDGAQFRSKNRWLETILHGLRSKSLDIVRRTLELLPPDIKTPHTGHSEPIILGASCQGHLEVLQHFLGPDDIVSDRILTIALSCASSRGHEAVVRHLLERGADPNAPMPLGQPLLLAARQGYLGIARMLVSNGAKVNEPVPLPIVQSIKLEHEGLFHFFREHGARLNSLPSGGAALKTAYTEELDSMMALLLRESADLDEAVADAASNATLREARGDNWLGRLLECCRKGKGFHPDLPCPSACESSLIFSGAVPAPWNIRRKREKGELAPNPSPSVSPSCPCIIEIP
jgi:ankyrin repeat protein